MRETRQVRGNLARLGVRPLPAFRLPGRGAARRPARPRAVSVLAPAARRAARAKGGDLLPKSSRSREQYSRPTGDCPRLDAAVPHVPHVPHEDAGLHGRSDGRRPSADGTRWVGGWKRRGGVVVAPCPEENECLLPDRYCACGPTRTSRLIYFHECQNGIHQNRRTRTAGGNVKRREERHKSFVLW